jgi:SOS-response transcriptional repressor LexA
MTRELVDYRLAQYRARRKQETPWRVLVTYPDLRAAAGAASVPVELPRETETVRLPTRARGRGLFAVRATGDSMEGGRRPIRDGDWLVMRRARGVSLADVEGKVALVESPDRDFGFGDRLKRVVREGEGWLLRSDNPARPSLSATRETVVVAVLVDVVRPEAAGAVGTDAD